MFVRKLRVMPSDASQTGEIKPYNLLNYFQDTAELAVEGIEGKSTELYARGYSWVVTRYEIEITGKLPAISEEFEVVTYHDPNHSYNTLRNFHVKYDGQEVVTAKTSWILADVRTGRPVKPLAHIPEIIGGDCEHIEDNFADIPSFDEPEKTEHMTVKYHDTDYNGHVNHAIYFRWIWDMIGRVPRRTCGLFRSGAKLGELITLENAGELYRVKRENNSRPCAEFIVKV